MLLQEILAAGTNIVEAATNLAHATSACKNQSAPVCATDIDKASDKHGSHFPTPPLRPNITCYKNKELSMNIIVGKRLLNWRIIQNKSYSNMQKAHNMRICSAQVLLHIGNATADTLEAMDLCQTSDPSSPCAQGYQWSYLCLHITNPIVLRERSTSQYAFTDWQCALLCLSFVRTQCFRYALHRTCVIISTPPPFVNTCVHTFFLSSYAGLSTLNFTLNRANKEISDAKSDCKPPFNPDRPSCSLSLLESALVVANLSLQVPNVVKDCAW